MLIIESKGISFPKQNTESSNIASIHPSVKSFNKYVSFSSFRLIGLIHIQYIICNECTGLSRKKIPSSTQDKGIACKSAK